MEPIKQIFGEDTSYEANFFAYCDSDTSMWYGSFVFKEVKYSPYEIEEVSSRFRYFTPIAGNGALAVARGENYWKTIVSIFELNGGG